MHISIKVIIYAFNLEGLETLLMGGYTILYGKVMWQYYRKLENYNFCCDNIEAYVRLFLKIMKINEPQTLVGTKLEGAIAEYLVPSPWIAYPTTAKLWWLTLEQQIQYLSSN